MRLVVIIPGPNRGSKKLLALIIAACFIFFGIILGFKTIKSGCRISQTASYFKSFFTKRNKASSSESGMIAGACCTVKIGDNIKTAHKPENKTAAPPNNEMLLYEERGYSRQLSGNLKEAAEDYQKAKELGSKYAEEKLRELNEK